jgi:hypothetical protein
MAYIIRSIPALSIQKRTVRRKWIESTLTRLEGEGAGRGRDSDPMTF